MRFYRGIDNGKKYEIKEEDSFNNNCPECGETLQWNNYKDLNVGGDNEDETSISITMEYCTRCNELYIRNDF